MRRALAPTLMFVAALALTRGIEGGAKTLRRLDYEIAAPEFTFDVMHGTITTSGRSRVSSERLELECGRLTAAFDEKSQKLLRLEAHESVRFTSRETIKGQVREVKGSARSVVLDNTNQELRLSGDSDLRVSAGKTPEGRITADEVTFRMGADRGNVVAEGKPKVVWGESTATGARIEADLTPDKEGIAEVRVTGGVVLEGIMEEKEGGKADGKVLSRRPVHAEGKQATWSQGSAKAVLRGAAKVDLGRGTAGPEAQLQEAHLTGEQIVIDFEPKPTIHVEDKVNQARVNVTTVQEEKDQPVREQAAPGTGEAAKPE